MSKKTRWGQHYLVNRSVAEKIIRVLQPVAGPVLEIGPGKGVLTSLLLKQFPEVPVAAVEIDPELFLELQQKFPDRLNLIHADILGMDPGALFPGKPVHLISNIPYCISKELIDWVITHEHRVQKAVFLFQREFAEKLFVHKHPRAAGAQGMLLNHLYSISACFHVHPGSFYPKPRIVSTLVSLEKNLLIPESEIPGFYSFLKRCFASRRKTLLNNLKNKNNEEHLKSLFKKNNIPLSCRPDELEAQMYFPVYQFSKPN